MLFVIGLALLCGKWITWWAAGVFMVYAAIKEFAIDPATEPSGWDHGPGVGDSTDFLFYFVGVLLGVLVVYFSQLRGSMWPWPPRCRPCCPPSKREDNSYVLCCGCISEGYSSDDEESDPRLQKRLREERERLELWRQSRAELQLLGLQT